MIDIHTHILPALDDGSESVEESLRMLDAELADGVNTVFATPHFYASRDTLDDFLKRRERAYARLLSAARAEHPRVLLGAELAYYSGISKSKLLSHFTVADTGILLLEMPESRWSDYTRGEVEELALSGKYTVVIAHAERCFDFQERKAKEQLLDTGVLVQANASFFINPKTTRRALKLLRDECIHFVASDAHGSEYRPPRLGEALGIIEKKLGGGAVRRLSEIAQGFIK